MSGEFRLFATHLIGTLILVNYSVLAGYVVLSILKRSTVLRLSHAHDGKYEAETIAKGMYGGSDQEQQKVRDLENAMMLSVGVKE